MNERKKEPAPLITLADSLLRIGALPGTESLTVSPRKDGGFDIEYAGRTGFMNALAARLRVMSGSDIYDKRRQAGTIVYDVDNEKRAFRVKYSSGKYGDKVTIEPVPPVIG